MVDSTDFSHYHLTGWNIDDDSLSYIDHDYWEGVLNQIVESEMGRKLSDLDRDKLFHKGFGLINNPPHGDRSGLRRYSKYSESRRFKFVIKCLWDITAGRDRGCTLDLEGKRRKTRDSADNTPCGKDFGNTICNMPVSTRGFFSFVVATLHAAKEYASKRSQIPALHQSIEVDSEERLSKETSPPLLKETSSNQEEPTMDQPMSSSSNGLDHSSVEQSDDDLSASISIASEQSEHSTGQGEVVEPLANSSCGLGHLGEEQLEVDRPASMSIASDSSENPDVGHPETIAVTPGSSEKSDSDRSATISIASNPSEQSNSVRPAPVSIESDSSEHSIQSEEVTDLIALAPNGLGHSIGPYHPPLVGIDITGHGSLLIKKAFLDKRTESQNALRVSLNVLCTQSKDYILCGLRSWEEGGHVEGQLALDIVGVWLEKSMRQYSCQTFICFIHDLGAGQQLDLEQLYRAAGGFSLVASRSKFDLVPKDAVVSNQSQNVSHNSSSHRHVLQITNQNVTSKFIGHDGASAREVEEILGLSMSIEHFDGKEYIVCKPHANQILDRQEHVNHERCRIGLEIISIWLWEHWDAKNDYIDLPGFLVCLKASNDKMALEEIYEAAIQSMRRTRLPYTQKAFFNSNYTIEAESGA
ncbi:hypothetical protein BCIN_12g01430 [Botrytis cinerea B05.10]|uniref:Uncharacterized protein n=1 Tax=Botryotinia fuckeliana (strain B05.10) TaxID=332648 RepID=A0A384JZ59_BOTFB|nr:hypothetical protein BCIN_12g01430 [Botrytis cinerea B05.10]ATZ55557.1 hypothetical protein BCIN_12g01430 [Botrytis cinerea B05.10]